MRGVQNLHDAITDDGGCFDGKLGKGRFYFFDDINTPQTVSGDGQCLQFFISKVVSLVIVTSRNQMDFYTSLT